MEDRFYFHLQNSKDLFPNIKVYNRQCRKSLSSKFEIISIFILEFCVKEGRHSNAEVKKAVRDSLAMREWRAKRRSWTFMK